MWISFLLLFTVGAAALAWWWRARAGRAPTALVAQENHRSVRKFHYGPAPAQGPLAAAPALAPDNPLSRLLPEEEFKAQQQSPPAPAAARCEAGQVAERQTAPAGVAFHPAPALVAASGKEPAPLLRSCRHAPGAIDVRALLSNEAPAPAGRAAAQPVAASGNPADEQVAQAIYDNALTGTTRTKNDAANRRAEAELRKQAALQAGAEGQSAARTALVTGSKAPD